MKVNTMIIDDNEADRYLLRRWLKTCSFEAVVSEASDGQDAIDFFEAHKDTAEEGYPPGIIFLDINMPRLNGFEFLEKFAKIREEGGLTSTVIVMFTSSPRQDDKDRAFRWEFVSDFLIKGDFKTAEIERIVGQEKVSKIS